MLSECPCIFIADARSVALLIQSKMLAGLHAQAKGHACISRHGTINIEARRYRCNANYIGRNSCDNPRDRGSQAAGGDLSAADEHSRHRPLISTAMVAAIGTGEAFSCGRDFEAWLGLVPQYNGGRV